MRPLHLLFVTLLLCTPGLNAQFDGTQISFRTEELINDNWEPGNQMVLKFAGDNAWFGDDRSSSWISQENFELRNCLEVEGQLIAFLPNRNQSTARSIKWVEEFKKIHGFQCQRFQVNWDDMQMDAWVFRDTESSYIPYVAQSGVTLEYTLKTGNFNKRFLSEAPVVLDRSKLDKQKIDDYKKMSFSEFSDFMSDLFRPKLLDKVPDFSVKDYDGEMINYAGSSPGLLLINFWYTQCPPCIKEIPELNSLKQKYHSEKIEFWAMTFDKAKLVKSFLTNHPFDFRIIADAKKTISLFDVKAYPTSILIDADGKIIKSFLGGDKNTLSELEALIEQHLH